MPKETTTKTKAIREALAQPGATTATVAQLFGITVKDVGRLKRYDPVKEKQRKYGKLVRRQKRVGADRLLKRLAEAHPERV